MQCTVSHLFYFIFFMHKYLGGDSQPEMVTHVLQFVFLGNTGFRFPFAHWPTKEADAATLHDLFWKAVFWLLKSNFIVTYCCCDGGESNRGFIKMQFSGKNPEEENFTVINPYTRKPLIFIVDFPVSVQYRM